MAGSPHATTPQRHAAWVPISGELDAGTVDAARCALLVPTTQTVVADLDGLTFCDSAGLAALLHVKLILDEQGRRLELANPPRHFLTLAQIAGVKRPFAIAD